MKTILLIIEREFLTRVKKKSFIILTILAPLLFAGFIFVYVGIATTKDAEVQNVTVIDKSGLLQDALQSTDNMKFTFNNTATVNDLKEEYIQGDKHVIVLSVGELDANNNVNDVAVYSDRQVNGDVISRVRNTLETQIEEHKLKGYDIENLDKILASIKTNVHVRTIKWDKEGKETETNHFVMMMISYAAALLIYLFIFMFGSMVMRGVIEEKSNRIIEVIVSSVRPFQLMAGKIIGIAAVGLLQFLLWILLTFGFLYVAQNMLGSEVQQAATEMSNMPGVDVTGVQQQMSGGAQLMAQVNNIMAGIPLTTVLVSFFLFFLFGYLLYASMFAAIGSAVENETETQQLILPVTIPLMIGIFLMIHTFQYPNSMLSFWGSIIPFTSPMVMMARIPFGGVPVWQIGLSLGLLFVTFLLFAWLSGKIYRVGILMYGKKASFKELWKWMWYKS